MTGHPCQICRRSAIPGLAYKNRPICPQCSPHALAGEMMLAFSETETEALSAGGETAGAYLESIDKTDLATLTGPEWSAFLGAVLEGYSVHMRGEVRKYPPF